jgi:hypothetical protein
MTTIKQLIKGSFLLGLFALASACVVEEPREGSYDHDHHRYYHEHQWRDCGDHAEFCH